jgi:hypothetical protein
MRKLFLASRATPLRLSFLTLALSAFLGAVAVTPANADTVSYTSAPFTGTSSLDALIQQFNPTLGNLTGASVTLNADLTPIVEVLNFTGSAAPFVYAFETTYTTNPVTNQVVFTPSPATVTDPYGNVQDVNFVSLVEPGVAPNPGLNQFDGTPVPFSQNTSIPIPDLSELEGAGTAAFDYTTDGSGNYGGSGTGEIYFGGDRSYAGTATVTYTYTAVPEPASFSILAIGGLAVLQRRRRS